MSLANIQGKLTREEMKNILAGVSTEEQGDGTCTMSCSTGGFTVSCSSVYGLCAADDSNPKDWIACDGREYKCC